MTVLTRSWRTSSSVKAGEEKRRRYKHTGFSETFQLCNTFVIMYVFVLLVQDLEVRDGGRAPVPPLHHHTHSAETQISCSPCYCCSPAADAEKGSAPSVPVPWCCPLTPHCAVLFSQNVNKEDLLKQTLDLSSQITGVVHLCLSFPVLPNPTTVTRLNVSLLRAARKSKCLKISCKYHWLLLFVKYSSWIFAVHIQRACFGFCVCWYKVLLDVLKQLSGLRFW